ncbi:MAG: OpgC family protein [Nevskiales bacterium]
MRNVAPPERVQRRLPRDARIDLLRGIALLMIFIDHVPGNVLALVTLRNFGFSDAAELFVLLAGVSSMLAYGGAFARDGPLVGLRRVLLRCLRLYLFQVILLLAVLIIVGTWLRYFGVQPESGAPFLHSGLAGLRRGLTLQAQPASLNILPLYIVLLALLPLIYGLIRLSPLVALAASGGLWLAVNLDPSINLTNWLDGHGWFFNPFAWQFLFVLGALGAWLLRRSGGELPHPVWLRALAWSYLGFALLAAAPWATWGLAYVHPIDLDPPDKTILAPLRLLNVLALVTLALGSARFRAIAEWRALSFIVWCGRHSLEVFSLGTVLAMFCRLAFRTFGVTVETQILANGVGLGLMIALALVLERARHPALAQPVRSTGRLVPAGAKSISKMSEM